MNSHQNKAQMINAMNRLCSNGNDAESELTNGLIRDFMFPPAWSIRSFTTVDKLPEELWCLRCRDSDKYYSVGIDDEPIVWCFPVMTKRFVADAFIQAIDEKRQNDLTPTAVTLDETKDIAEERGMDALLLVDDLDDIKICYVD